MTEPFVIGIYTSDPGLRLKVLEAQVQDSRKFLYTIMSLLAGELQAVNDLLAQIRSLAENVKQREGLN